MDNNLMLQDILGPAQSGRWTCIQLPSPFSAEYKRRVCKSRFAFVVTLGAVWRAHIVWGRHGTISDLGAVLVYWLLYFALLVLLDLAPEEKAVLERWRK